MAPSPTAEAHRLTDPLRTSPAAKMPGRLVSRKYGGRPAARQLSPYPAVLIGPERLPPAAYLPETIEKLLGP